MPVQKTQHGQRRRKRKSRLRPRRVCKMCRDRMTTLDYQDTTRLQKFVTERGKIVPARVSGACAKHQRQVASAVKRAREVALLPFQAT